MIDAWQLDGNTTSLPEPLRVVGTTSWKKTSESLSVAIPQSSKLPLSEPLRCSPQACRVWCPRRGETHRVLALEGANSWMDRCYLFKSKWKMLLMSIMPTFAMNRQQWKTKDGTFQVKQMAGQSLETLTPTQTRPSALIPSHSPTEGKLSLSTVTFFVPSSPLTTTAAVTASLWAKPQRPQTGGWDQDSL